MTQEISDMRQLIILLSISSLVFVSSCRPDENTPVPTTPVTEMNQLVVPASFNYQNSREVEIQISLRNEQDEPIAYIPLTILDKPVQVGGKVLFTALSDINGVVRGKMVLPSYLTMVYVSPNFIGLPNDLPVNVNQSLTMTVGGPNATPVSRTAPEFFPEMLNSPGRLVQIRTNTVYSFKAGYSFGSNGGVPTNLLTPRDVISNSMLELINTSLPEQKPVPVNHPDYLNPNSNINIKITELADVWITFVHEGAGYKNTLGYYVYDTNNPPTNANDIDSIFYLFPNASFVNAGGGLRSGDKLFVGRFPAGKTIGWVLLANGWSNTNVNSGAQKFYSDKSLNPESAIYKQHHVLLHDNINNLFLVGFEDQFRENGGSDNDFNDLVFYVKSNPVRAISTEAVNPIDQPGDSDGDGVSDVYDRYPNDNTLAYRNVYPAEGSWGTLAFEDLWPGSGDYDMNDLVLNYQYTIYANARNEVKNMDSRFIIKAIGATYRNGFAFELPVAASFVNSVTGQDMRESYITLAGNGTEAGVSTKAIIPVFDNAHLISPLPAPYFLNTQPEAPFVTPDTLNIRVNFNTGLNALLLGTAPFNPFIMTNKQRGHEVHLPGMAATSKANTALFGTSSDGTNAITGNWYKTKNNLPFALHMVEPYDYPREGRAILYGYPRFADWAQSGGSLAKDWYLDIPGNRNSQHIY